MRAITMRIFIFIISFTAVLLGSYVKGADDVLKTNLLKNSSFEIEQKKSADKAQGWRSYHDGYSRVKNKSYAPDANGQWSCKITGTGQASEKGLGGAIQVISGKELPAHGTFTVTNSIYIAAYTQGKINKTYITVNYKDKSSKSFSFALSDTEIENNINRWKTYSTTFTTDSSKKINSIVYWCLVWQKGGKKFIGTLYFDEPELKQVSQLTLNNPGMPFLRANKTNIPPVLDGKLNDSCWENSIELSPFFLASGKALAAQQTKGYISYDQNNIYIAMVCSESILDPILQKLSEFKAEKTTHDSRVWEDDCVEVFIKPSSKKKTYYHFVVNSKGTVYDAKIYDKKWNSNVKVKTFVGKNYWVVEMSISFDSLGQITPDKGSKWRINLCRSEKAFKENSCWSPTAGPFHTPSNFGEVCWDNISIGARIKSIGRLQKEKNDYLKVSFVNSDSTTETIKTQVMIYDENEQCQIERKYLLLAASESQKESVKYFVETKNKRMQYQLWRKNDLLYSSPSFPFVNNTIFIAKTAAFTNMLTKFYLVDGELLYLPLVLQTNIDKKAFQECELTLEVPAFLNIISPTTGERKCPSPINIVQKIILRNKLKYRQYKLKFDVKNISFSSMNSKNSIVINPLLFKSKLTLNNQKSYKIYYQTSFNQKQKNAGEVSLFLLPPFTQKIPKQSVVCNWPSGGAFFRLFSKLSSQECSEIVKSWARTGFSLFVDNTRFSKYSKKYNLKAKGQIHGSVSALSKNVASIGAYLKKHPECQAVTGDGTKKKDVVSPAYLLNPDYQVGDIIKQYVGKKALKYPMLSWDYEVPVYLPTSIGFNQANLELFRTFAKIPLKIKLTSSLVINKYIKQWIDFRCKQNANIFKLLQAGIKVANPNCVFIGYSGYQGVHTKKRYGINWKYVSKYVDEVWCGYARPLEQINATLDVINDKPLIGGELVWLGYGNRYNQDKVAVNLFRRLTDCGGGVMVYYDWTVDGRFYKGISQIASVCTDFEKFFEKYSRNDSLVKVLNGSKRDVAVLKNGQERLLFLFNDTDIPRKFKIKNIKLSSNMTGVEYWEKKIVEIAPFINTTVAAYEVKVIHVINMNNTSVPPAPQIIRQSNGKIIPFLIWEDSNAGSSIYEVEYSKDRNFVKGTTKTINKLAQNYCKITTTLEKDKPYYWRVRAIDIVTNQKSPFSETGSFSLASLLNANISATYFSPNNDGKYDEVQIQAEMHEETAWVLKIQAENNQTIRLFAGQGDTVSVVWDGKNDKGSLSPEGTYTVSLSVKDNPVFKQKVHLNMGFGAKNPKIEQHCLWSSATFAGSDAIKDYNIVYDNLPYALSLKGNNDSAKAYWSNYRADTGISVKAGQKYSFKAFVKTLLKGQGSAAISLHFFTKDNRWAVIPNLKNEWNGIEKKLSGTNEWTELSVSCIAPKNATKAILFFKIKGEGTAWLGAMDFKKEK